MNNVVALVVMLGWVGVGAWLIAGRRSDRVGDSMGDFKNQLGTLERRTPTTSLSHKREFPEDPTAPRDLHEAAPKPADGRNQAEIFFGLLFGAVLCGLLGTMSVLRLLWIAAGAFLIAALTYGGLWWSSAAEKRRKAEMDAWFGPRGQGSQGQGAIASHGYRQQAALPAAPANGYYDEHGNWWQAQQAYDVYGQPVFDAHGRPVYQSTPAAALGGYGPEQYQSAAYDHAGQYQPAGQYQHADGYDAEGFDVYGYNAEGFDRYGYDHDGFDAEGYDAYGYDHEGYDRDGYPFEANDDEEYELFWAGRGQQWQNAQVYNLNDWRPEYRQAANY